MSSRLNLQMELETILGSKNVYYQPPENLKLTYPAIVYELDRTPQVKADNRPYLRFNKYSVTYITKKATNTVVDDILDHFAFSEFDRSYKVDGLNHYVIGLFYNKEEIDNG